MKTDAIVVSYLEDTQEELNLLFFVQGSDSPSSSTPEDADTEDDGQAVSR